MAYQDFWKVLLFLRKVRSHLEILFNRKFQIFRKRYSLLEKLVKALLTFKCMTEHLFADFSYSIALDTYLWKQMMQMNRKLIHIWYNVDKKHLLFTKRKCHKFSWLFTASRCSPRRRSICACRIPYKVWFFKKRLPSWKTVFVKRDR